MNTAKAIPRWLQWGVYPSLLVLNLALVSFDISEGSPGRHAGILSAFNVLSLMLLEYLYPMQQRWKMNWFSAKRDLFFMVIGIGSLIFSNWALTAFAIAIAPKSGLLNNLSVIHGTLIAMLVVQFFQYWLHRLLHESNGNVGRIAWRVHRAHHVLEKVYVLMHVRAHPVDAFLTRLVFILPLTLLGINANALYAMSIIVGLQGLISHLNVDLRAGWMNYLLTGTELHRYHHSADAKEGKNYGAFLPIYDLIFGTFVYRPNQAPAELGVSQEDEGPDSSATLAHIVYPFRSENAVSRASKYS